MLQYNELAQIVQELKPVLEGSIIQKVFEDEHRAFVLRGRRPGLTLLTLISLDAKFGRIHLVEDKPTQPPTPSHTTMVLRKWLCGMVIRDVNLAPNDRVLMISGDTSDPNWSEDSKPPRIELSLIVEWTGKVTNMLVCGEDKKIIHMLRADQHDRDLKVGQAYTMPKPPPAASGEIRWPNGIESPNAWIAEHYTQHISRSTFDDDFRDTQLRLKRFRKKLRRLIRNIEQDLQNANEAQDYKKWGELLQGAYGQYDRGMKSMSVTDYYDPELGKIDIPLDPTISLQENINAYFKRYKRLNGAVDVIETRLLTQMDVLEQVEQAQETLIQIHDLEVLQTKRHQWTTLGILPKIKKQARPGTRVNPSKLPFRTVQSSRGTTILVGRGRKGNDHLSTKTARGRDMWFHARDWAGAHVILRVERGQQPHDKDMIEAAMLAAHFSKGKHDSLIDVTYTQAKHVRKPKGYPPGLVTVAGGSTLAIQVDEEVLKSMLGQKQ